MFTWYGTYPEACAYVMGFGHGVGGSLLEGFQQWLGPRHEGRTELAFWVLVLREAFPSQVIADARHLTDDQHRVANDKLFELLDAYLAHSEALEET